ncbi:MAG: hypothetical protein EBT80_00110 [Chitinophagales bacterium]|nr:hypothetical protein [Chitinophagales bacterium]
MADERVSIVIDVDVKDVQSIAAVQAALTNLNRSQKNNSASMRVLRGDSDKTKESLVGAASGTRKLEKGLEKVSGAAKFFQKTARALMFSVIAMGIEFAITAASLASINLVFAAGKYLAKGYQIAMQALAGTLAAVGVAALGAAAAFREFTAAQFAFRFKGSNNVKAGIADSTGALRNLYADSTLATAGIQALNQAFAAVAKNSAFTPQTQAGLRAMMDFAVASGDTTKGLASAANFLGLIQKEGKFTQEALAAAKEIGPEFDKAFKKLRGSGKINSTDDFFQMLSQGELAKEAGVIGAAGIVQQTLFAQFKGYLTRLYGEVASIGQSLLDPFKKTLFDVFIIVRRTIRRISGDLLEFGRGGMLDTLVSAVDKLADFSVNLFRKFLPQADGFFGRINKVYTAMYRYTRRFLDVISPLREGGRVIIDTFGKPLSEILKGFGRNIQGLADLGAKNRDKFLSFGEALKNVVAAFFEMSNAFKQLFTDAIPIINKILGAISLLMKGLAGVFSMFSKMGPLAAFLPVFMTLALAMKGRRSRRAGGSFLGGMLMGNTPGIPGMMGKNGMAGAMASAAAPLGSAASNLTAAAGTIGSTAAPLTSAAGSLTAAAGSLSAAATAQFAYFQKGSMPLKGGRGARYVEQNGKRVFQAAVPPVRPPGMSQYEYNNLRANWMQKENAAYANVTGKTLEDRGWRMGTPNTPGSRFYDPTREAEIQKRATTKAEYRAQESARRLAARQAAGGATGPSSPFNPLNSSTYRYQTDARLQASGILPKGGGGGGLVGGLAGGKVDGALGGNFFGNMRTFGQSTRQGFNALRMYGQNKRAAFGGGVQKFLGGTAGGQQMLSEYRAALAQQQAAGGPISRGKALKAGLGANFGIGTALAGMGASYLSSKYGSEEAQGALQAGSAVMAISPLAGIAVGGLGTAMSAQTKMGGTLSGAVGGAAAGAMIGSIIPGLGTAVGGLIGAGLGAAVGFFKSQSNQNKLRKEATGQISGQMLTGVVKAMYQGQTATAIEMAKKNTERMKKLAKSGAGAQNAELDKLVEAGVITSAQRERAMSGDKDRQKVFDQLAKDAVTQEKVTGKLTERFSVTMKALRQATGMTEEEIMALANKMGVNLYEDTLNLNDAMTRMGKGMVKTAKELDNAIKDHVLRALDNLENFKTESELAETVNVAQNAFNAGPSMDTAKSVISELTMFLQNKYPNNQAKVVGSLFEMFDSKSPNYVFGANGPLGEGFAKLPADKQKELQDVIRNQFLLPAVGGAAEAGTTQIGAKLTAENLVAGEGALKAVDTRIQEILKSGDQVQIDKLQNFLKYGSLVNMTGPQAASELEKVLGLKPGALGTFATRSEEKLVLSPLEEGVKQQIIDAIATGLDSSPAWWDTDVPDWWQRGLKVDKDGNLVPNADTSTPRRGRIGDTSVSKRLRSTLGAHAAINGRLTGKRTITSAFRTSNLGSPSSDHATGNAYDLTGQNLGQYAKMIKNSGGFAEFHGVNANRHLHVVPRTGDTSSRRSGDGSGTAISPSVTVNVYPSPGMDIDQLVAKTIRAQEKAMRDTYERM